MAIRMLPNMRTWGGKNAVTAIENYTKLNTRQSDYLQSNQGYGALVGVKFIDKDGNESDKTYDYVSLTGTERVGDRPTVEVTNKFTGANRFVPGKHTKIVSVVKGGLEQNASRLDAITNKGINLKVIDRQANIKERLFPGMQENNFKNLQKMVGG